MTPNSMRQLNKAKASPDIRVKALFMDYDGTISPINVPKSESSVPQETSVVLNKIGKQIPIAIVTTKSLQFVFGRTPFAHAWSALGGLETRIGNVTTKARTIEYESEHLTVALSYSRDVSYGGLTIEEKCDCEGRIVAFSVDWRQCEDCNKAKAAALKVLSFCETLSIFVIRYKGQPFFDVFAYPIDKGKAMVELKEGLGLNDGVLYMGDSTADNPAFELADLSVGVVHAETPKELACDYFIKFEDVPVFLKSLLENGLQFDPGFSMVTHAK